MNEAELKLMVEQLVEKMLTGEEGKKTETVKPEKPKKTEYSIQQEPSTYQTGSTKPPKNYTGLIIVLLGLVIFLGGIVAVRYAALYSLRRDPAPRRCLF